jgi:hypothetical protein
LFWCHWLLVSQCPVDANDQLIHKHAMLSILAAIHVRNARHVMPGRKALAGKLPVAPNEAPVRM